jgi:uncharacterized protein (TIRG00374 family)
MPEAVLAIKNIYSKNRTVFLLILKILISAGIMILILYQINLFEIFQMIKNSNKLIILAAFGLSIGNIYLQYLKWKLVCNIILREYDKKKILISLFYGFSAGSFTPARIGEYFGRAISFTDRPLLEVTAATITDKLFTMLIVSVIGLILFLFYIGTLEGVAGVLIISLLIYSAIYNRHSFRKNTVVRRLLKFKRISSFYNRINFLKNFNYSAGINLTILSILFYFCFILQFALLISAFTNHLDILNYLWAGSLVMFFKTIIPSVAFGDLGVREGASVYFITHFGGAAAAGFNASILLFIINVLLPALSGLIFIIKKKC